ncbi:hypothetical protein L6452_00362 [Arctium lappa]|uniref:Uncharacterized protein n=1 Tax=Arctium lappa TaxID=4217 RepID=A0ACB9FEH6_ARCLA|nr:hypothetical protein L6452_00362 [Arctium lappa]
MEKYMCQMKETLSWKMEGDVVVEEAEIDFGEIDFRRSLLEQCEMERQCNDSNTNTQSHNQPIGSSPVINSMNESNNNSQLIGSSPAINSVTQDETQDDVESGSKKRKERSGSSASHRVEFKKLVSNIASIANQHDDLGVTNFLEDDIEIGRIRPPIRRTPTTTHVIHHVVRQQQAAPPASYHRQVRVLRPAHIPSMKPAKYTSSGECENDECVICMEEFEEMERVRVVVGCQHFYCRNEWLEFQELLENNDIEIGRITRPPPTTTHVVRQQQAAPPASHHRQVRGVQRSAHIPSMTPAKYTSSGECENDECVICMEEFEEMETVRVVVGCQHLSMIVDALRREDTTGERKKVQTLDRSRPTTDPDLFQEPPTAPFVFNLLPFDIQTMLPLIPSSRSPSVLSVFQTNHRFNTQIVQSLDMMRSDPVLPRHLQPSCVQRSNFELLAATIVILSYFLTLTVQPLDQPRLTTDPDLFQEPPTALFVFYLFPFDIQTLLPLIPFSRSPSALSVFQSNHGPETR